MKNNFKELKNNISQNSKDSLKNTLIFQFDISWKLLEIHLKDIEDEECFWRPGKNGLHVTNRLGSWIADWTESESYNIGPSSIAWLTWHIIFWWSMVIDYSFGDGLLTREDVKWPGNMALVTRKIKQLKGYWRNLLVTISEEEFSSNEKTKWPFKDRPFCELAAWLNLELMKNASEIGYCRFLYASRKL